MNDPIKKAYDIDSIRKDIQERQQMINEYQMTRRLDRDKAISKIQELRITNENVAAVTAVKLAQYSIPFSQATYESIVAELKMQMDILTAELAKELSEQREFDEKRIEKTAGICYNENNYKLKKQKGGFFYGTNSNFL